MSEQELACHVHAYICKVRPTIACYKGTEHYELRPNNRYTLQIIMYADKHCCPPHTFLLSNAPVSYTKGKYCLNVFVLSL